jgi:MraZ protein
MSMLRGNAPATVDVKGRLKIPSAFRAAIQDTWGSDFSDYYVTSMTGDSALVYPLPVWQEIEDRLNELPFFDPTKKSSSTVRTITVNSLPSILRAGF